MPAAFRGFVEHDLLTSASAIAFRVLFAAAPVLLFLLALSGFLALGDVWAVDIAPRIAPFLPPSGFAFLNESVEPLLRTRQGLWLTAGAALALWEVSSAMRAVMDALNRVYRSDRARTFSRSVGVSVLLALGAGTCYTLAALVIAHGPFEAIGLSEGLVLGALDFLVRWALGLGLLFAGIAIIVRFAPATPQPLSWVSLGSVLTVAMWIVTSLAFGWYLTSVAPYTTIFGSLAFVIVLMTYLDLSVIVFLFGVALDAAIREQVEGTAHPE